MIAQQQAGIALLIAVAAMALPLRSASAGDPTPVDADPDTEIARRHFEAGTALYGRAKYQEAILEFEAARNAKPLPAFDFNIARAYDRLEHAQEAIAAYERFAAEAPTDPDAPEVRARIAVLRQRLVGTALPTIGAETSPPLLARHRRYTWIVAGAGAALLAGALAAGLVANSRYGALRGECASDGACNAATAPDAQGLIDGGRSAGLASDVLLGVGLAAVATGVVLFFVEGRRPAESHALRLVPAASGAGLAWELP